MNRSSLLLAIPLIIFISCKEGKKQRITSEAHYPIQIVDTCNLTLNSDYAATVTGRQTVEIRPQIDGMLTRICIREGDAVHKGQILFEIDPAQFEAAYDIARANVLSAEASVSTAQLVFDSNKELYDEKVISEFELNTAKNELAEANARLKLANAELAKAATNLSYTKVKSPVNGVASMIPYRVGVLVGPNITQPLITVSDDNEIYAYFSMAENQMLDILSRYGSLKKAISDMPEVEFRMSNGQIYQHKGHIDAVSGTIDSSTGAISFRAAFPNPDQLLRDGATGRVIIPTVASNAIVIPQTATYELQNKIFAYKVVDGKAVSTEIEVLPQSDGRQYVVTAGLEKGDTIVSEGAGLIKEGTEIHKQ